MKLYIKGAVSRDEDYQGWLEARRKVVSASESAHLMGAANQRWRKSAEQLAEEKLNPPERFDNKHMAAGRFWEDHIIGWFNQATGLGVVPNGCFFRHPEHAMGATPDGFLMEGPLDETWCEHTAQWLTVLEGPDLLTGEGAVLRLRQWLGDDGAVVEVKHQPSKRRSYWNKPLHPPADYECQVQHQATVCSTEKGLLLAKVDHNELYCHLLERDEMFCELLVDTCNDFAETYLR